MSKAVMEKAKCYYPAHWTKSYLYALIEKGKLTKDEYKEVTGEDYHE